MHLLENAKKPISVPDIIKELRQKKLTTNKTTVYRYLALLLEQNRINEIEFREGKKRYELSNSKHHHHIICKNCDRIEDVEIGDAFKIEEKKIEHAKKFKVLSHSLEFFGLCADCQ